MPRRTAAALLEGGRLWGVRLALWLGAAAALWAAPLAQAAGEPNGVLRVCSDPNNLPFSNRQERGFENQIARILADELGERLEYFWWAQRRGFFRNTLHARQCDVVMGVPLGTERAQTTRAYYRSSYVFVQRRGAAPIHSLDDPALRALRIGIQLVGDDADNPPPAYALARRGIIDNVRGFMVYGDHAEPEPEILRALADRSLDVAVVWGPLAGYFARRSPSPFAVRPVSPQREGALAMSFEIGLGVRPGDDALAQRLERALHRRSREIEHVLERFGVPRLRGTP